MLKNLFGSAKGPIQINVNEVLLEIRNTIIKVSTVSAIHYQNHKSIIHLKNGKFIELEHNEAVHKALIFKYKSLLQRSLPNKPLKDI